MPGYILQLKVFPSAPITPNQCCLQCDSDSPYFEAIKFLKVKKIILIRYSIFVLLSCNNGQTDQVALDSANSNSKIKDSTNKDILKIIHDYSELEFRNSRREIVEQGTEHKYQVSEIRDLGNTLKYDVVVPGIEGKTEYACNPQKGEIIMIMVGDNDITRMYFNQAKMGLKSANCNKTDVGEQCESYQNMTSYPIKTHFIVSLVSQDSSTSIYLFKRTLLPRNN